MKHPVLKKIVGVLLCGCKRLGLFPLSARHSIGCCTHGNKELSQRAETSSIELASLREEGGVRNGRVWRSGFT